MDLGLPTRVENTKNSNQEPVRQELLMQTHSKVPPEHGYARLDEFAPPDKWECQYLP